MIHSAEVAAAALLLRRLYPTGDSATVAELITQAANELQRTRAATAHLSAILRASHAKDEAALSAAIYDANHWLTVAR